MSELSTFESRTGKLDCTTSDVYNFVTDIRNFEQFIPRDKVKNVNLDQDSCSLQVNLLGPVNIRIQEKIMYSKVVFSGNAMQVNNFSLVMKIHETENKNSEVNIILMAELNPILKMIASEQIKKFLETLICEMEKFKGWKDIN
jgi:carbon monoxide dehydrogenase subunit G